MNESEYNHQIDVYTPCPWCNYGKDFPVSCELLEAGKNKFKNIDTVWFCSKCDKPMTINVEATITVNKNENYNDE